MTDTTQSPKPQLPRWIKFALIGSIALNCLAIGVIGGFALKAGDGHKRGGERFVGRLIKVLPEERRDFARTILMQDREEVRALRRDLDAADREVIRALSAETFSGEALREALSDKSGIRMQRRALHQNRIVDLMSQLTPAERMLIAGAMQERLDRRQRRNPRP